MTVTEWLNDLTGPGTLALAVATACLGGVTRRVVQATERDIAETRKARVDDSAPLLTFLPTDAERYAHRQVDHDVNGRVFMNEPFTFGVDTAPSMMYVSATFLVINEGRSTAVLTLPPNVIVTEARRLSAEATDEVVYRPPIDSGVTQALMSVTSYALEPAHRIHLWVRLGQDGGTWIADHQAAGGADPQPDHVRALSVEVVSRSTLAEGVEDTTTLQVRAVPITQAPDQLWSVRRPVPLTYEALPTVRAYRGDVQLATGRRRRIAARCWPWQAPHMWGQATPTPLRPAR